MRELIECSLLIWIGVALGFLAGNAYGDSRPCANPSTDLQVLVMETPMGAGGGDPFQLKE